ncbi:ABC-type transport system, involved in lipoprotein release, permease component [Pyrobaculum oguniense TE7]|uniref:ABC-type transport system, involved in lipoprotein release, permease component n=1 Tax=Pyrobaculum oguniense (strain DSM 13380 / JCM 10595 / TE7) TaxID=698757 RepID=H6Q8U4_PYROT|nr:ABC-type transport system, involved in lipoprotein release, permease component [Pyrobaculum oguniense TE7]
MLSEILRLAWQALWERKGRTIGAVVGVVIAFTALSYALLLGQTFKDSVTQYFTSNFQMNVLYVTGAQFTDADVGTMSTISGVELAVPIASARGTVRVPGSSAQIPVTVYGVPPSLLPQVLPPTALYDGELAVGSNLALVGYYVAFDRSTGAQRVAVGSPLSLNVGRRAATVVASGIMATGALGFVDTTRGVVMDINTFRQLTGITSYSLVMLYLRDVSQLDAVSNEVKANFPNVDVISPQAILQTINSFLTSFQLFLGLIAGVSTVITALWLYDTMSISVVQRTKEIGILRAVGFRRRDVMAVFLAEAFIIAIIGVLIGLLAIIPLSQIGLPMAGGGQQQPASAGGLFRPPHGAFNISSITLDPLILAATGALVVAINIVGALLPAYRAGRLDVVSALRYE